MAKDERLYARFDIGMDEHPKIMLLSDTAFRVLIEATMYARRQLTDGFLDERVALRKWGAEPIRELANNHPDRPSLVKVEGGWHIRDYAEHQITRADIEVKRNAGRKGGLAKAKQTASTSLAPATNLLQQTASTSLAKTETETETETKEASLLGDAKLKERRLPADWSPSKSHYDLARALNVDLPAEAEAFRLHAETHDRHAARWNAAFTTWLKKAKPASSGLKPNPDWALRL